MNERQPADTAWRYLGRGRADFYTRAQSIWQRGPVRVVSSLIHAELPDRSGSGLQWLVSVSRSGKRPKHHDVRKALRAFGMQRAEEDNHHPGAARYFFLVCDPAHRVDCECKDDEVTVTDADGYQWTTPTDPTQCRGCQYEGWFGRPCPIHTDRNVRELSDG